MERHTAQCRRRRHRDERHAQCVRHLHHVQQDRHVRRRLRRNRIIAIQVFFRGPRFLTGAGFLFAPAGDLPPPRFRSGSHRASFPIPSMPRAAGPLLCRFQPETARGSAGAPRQLVAKAILGAARAPPAIREFLFPMLRAGWARSARAAIPRFPERPFLPRAFEKSAGRAARRPPRTSRVPRLDLWRPQSPRCSREVSSRRAGSQTIRGAPRRFRWLEMWTVAGRGTPRGGRPGAPAPGSLFGLLQRGTASCCFFCDSNILSLRRCLMRSSNWLQKRWKYCAADTSALTTTSHSNTVDTGRIDGCRAPTISTATAHTCNTTFGFPSADAAMVKPSADAMFRSPKIVNSLPMMITTIQGATRE